MDTPATTRMADTRPVGLSLRAIVEAALDIVSRGGVGQLTMRRLAEDLGVRAPTLYHHVADKAQLLDLLSAEAFRSLPRMPEAYENIATLSQWTAQVRSDAIALGDFYRRHPGLAAVVSAGQAMHEVPHDESLGEARAPELDALIRLGVPRATAAKHIQAVAWWTMAAVAAEFGAGRSDGHFDMGLDLMLIGLETQLLQAAEIAESAKS